MIKYSYYSKGAWFTIWVCISFVYLSALGEGDGGPYYQRFYQEAFINLVFIFLENWLFLKFFFVLTF